MGVVLEIDEAAATKQRIDRVRLLIWRDPQRLLPKIIALDVNRVHFQVTVIVKEKLFWPQSYRSLVVQENNRQALELPDKGCQTSFCWILAVDLLS